MRSYSLVLDGPLERLSGIVNINFVVDNAALCASVFALVVSRSTT